MNTMLSRSRAGLLHCRRRGTMACVLLACAAQLAHSQQGRAVLPDAPGFTATQAAVPAQDPTASATLTGSVLDASGTPLPKAQITLSTDGGNVVRGTQSDDAGQYALQGISAGTYRLTIASPDLQTYVSPPFTLASGERKELPGITLGVATVTSSVQVIATEEQVAEAQVKAEEKQRVLGIVPNFYSSYIWDAAPLSAPQKFALASKSAFDPVAFLSIGVVAGIEQARNIYPGYRQGAEGYAKRYGASFGDEAIGRFFASAVYPSLFRQDPRYFYKGSGTKAQRAVYAITRVFVTRGNNGKPEPNYSLLLGRLTAGAIANLYHDSSDRGVGLTFENAFLNIGGHAFDNLIREFVMKRFTPKLPPFENGEAANTKP